MQKLIVVLVVVLAFGYGLAVGVYKVFPFTLLQGAQNYFVPEQEQVGVSYDFENDPIGRAFYGKVPPMLETVLSRYEALREYSTADFPLSPERHAAFKERVTDTLVSSMDGPGSRGSDWVVSDPSDHSVLDAIQVADIETVTVEGHRIELKTITNKATGDVVPMAMCFPQGAAPAPAVVLFSGHTHWGLRELFVDRASYQGALALVLCEAGFATAAIEKIDSGIVSELFQQQGERWRGDRWADDEFEAATTLLAMGDYSIPARQLMANIAAVEVFASDPRVDADRIGAAGLSLGGWLTLHTALVNSRIKAVANFGGMWTYVEQYLDGEPDLSTFEGINDYSQLFAGAWRLGDQNRWLFAAAPLVMLTGYGEKDVPYTNFKEAYHPLISQQYEALGASENIEVVTHDGGHVFPIDAVVDFFKRRLSGIR